MKRPWEDPMDDYWTDRDDKIRHQRDPQFCKHGANAMCEYCMPLELYHTRYVIFNLSDLCPAIRCEMPSRTQLITCIVLGASPQQGVGIANADMPPFRQPLVPRQASLSVWDVRVLAWRDLQQVPACSDHSTAAAFQDGRSCQVLVSHAYRSVLFSRAKYMLAAVRHPY
ncbi:hypothetical protein CALVIDRAFT_415728 [Calocera viscosa TUFC12733]|uniref:NPL4 zinc-binding putative domain-containing protein n=1 Tax=Calocera viscosa (strain TUFC12733) TaxID=1330018 RepID=A0A167G0D7_CALVF|nr:hypothetical protein CALVIDRAFT_415728 [Calocera viscosa TUFC12733]